MLNMGVHIMGKVVKAVASVHAVKGPVITDLVKKRPSGADHHKETRRHRIELGLTMSEAVHLHNLLEADLQEGKVHKDHTKAIKSVLAELHFFLPPMKL